MKNEMRARVKEHYGKIAARVSKKAKSSCCAGGCGCSSGEITDTASFYKGIDLKDLPVEAVNASLGCDNPLVYAQLQAGETVLDLGSGGGIDVLIASKYVGQTGKIYGLDMTDEMLRLANENKAKMGVQNVEFLKGYIEKIPLPDESIDAIISNCVINLSEDKEKVIQEMYRVLKPGGRIAIADIVMLKGIPESLKRNTDLWSSCISGSMSVDEYKTNLRKTGFKQVSINPSHIYTKKVIQQEILNQEQMKQIQATDLEAVDGAFAGAQIKAWK